MGKKSGKKGSKKGGKNKGGIPSGPEKYADMPVEDRKAKALKLKEEAGAALMAGLMDEAEKMYTNAIDYDRTDATLYSNRAACFTNLNKVNAAVKDAEACVSLKPEWFKGYLRLGNALTLKGKYSEAVTVFAQGQNNDKENAAELSAGLEKAKDRLTSSLDTREAIKAIDAAMSKVEITEEEKVDVLPEDEVIVGIDLGTTYSCVGVWKDGAVEIIANSEGKRTTPSVVGFGEEDRLVGEAAVLNAASNPTNTVYDAKRLIGASFKDEKVHQDVKRFAFKVTEGEGSKPVIEVDFKGEKKQFAPEEISSMVLSKMAETAASYLGHPVKNAVVTVPAYFNDSQRVATRNAGTIAGLNVKRIINEPTAAAVAYGLDNKDMKDKAMKVLVFDLGGGTFDVSLLLIEGGIFEVLATGGDTHLGGEDFDDNVVQHLAAEFKKKTGCDVFTNPRAIRRLRTQAEKAKRMLSSSTTAAIEVDELMEGNDFSTNLSRAKFEAINKELFGRCLDAVKKVLADAKMTAIEVDDVVLVGGSTRIPKVQAVLKEMFDGKELCKSINPDEAVAYGAAVQGGILSGAMDNKNSGLLLVDVTPLSLGIETTGKLMSNIIKRNTPIPVRKTKTYTTEVDFQAAVDIPIYEGERSCTDGNNLLGEFTISGIERAKRGVPQIEVTFDLDANGILSVTAKDLVTNSKADITISNDKGRLSTHEIERMIKDAEKYKVADENHKIRAEARSELDQLIYTGRTAVKNGYENSGATKRVTECEILVEEAREFLDKNPLASTKEIQTYARKLQRMLGN